MEDFIAAFLAAHDEWLGEKLAGVPDDEARAMLYERMKLS
jgi:hypothetical protein